MHTQSNEKIKALKDKVKGEIVLYGDPNYNDIRKIWNAMIDRQPAVIVQCAEADDVPHAISYAHDNGLEISIRGGGHNIAGSALCNNGVMIDFSNMKSVKVECEIFVGLIAGAANRVSSNAMAYGHRDAKFVLNVHGRWDEAAQDKIGVAWARAFFKASAPFASAGAYVNFMTEEEGDRVAAAYGENYARLKQVKKQYDPKNIFHNNQNIKA